MKVPQYIYSVNYDDLQRYLALFIQQCQADLSENGWQIPVLTNAQRDIIIDSTFMPVMRFGTLWANSDIGKLQFITAQAIPDGLPGGPANATYETIMSA